MDVIEIDLGADIARLEPDSVERWSWFACGSARKPCPFCSGSMRVRCEECHGDGAVECNLGHEHECEECDGDGEWDCEDCDDRGTVSDSDSVAEIVMRLNGSWQCDVTLFNGRMGSASFRDTPQAAFDAAHDDTDMDKKRSLRRAA